MIEVERFWCSRHGSFRLDSTAGAGELGIVVDGYDAQARVPQLGRILANELHAWPAKRLYFRVASRTVKWSLLLEGCLRHTFEHVEVREILPLRRADARHRNGTVR